MIGGHGHVQPRPDGVRARCGGPAICYACALEQALARAEAPAVPATCPTPCDPDCDTHCHEAHAVRWKRDHEPEVCPAGTTVEIR